MMGKVPSTKDLFFNFCTSSFWISKLILPLLVLASTLLVNTAIADDIDYDKVDVWGPGLNVNAQLPTRYVYVQLFNKDGSRTTSSGGKMEAALTASGVRRFAGRVGVYDRKDGSYIINIRPVLPMGNVTISLSLEGRHIGDPSYAVPGMMYQENCDCPVESADEWLEALQCPETFSQLEDDLAPFSDIDMREVESEVHRRWPKRPGTGALMHYIVKNNRVYRKEIGSICGFKMFTDSILLSLIRKVGLPDMEFFINLGDWPLLKKHEANLPIFSWCGSDETTDIILPTYDVTDASIKSLGQVTIDLFTVQDTQSPSWPEKIEKALFRGRDSRKERLELVRLARKGDNSELIDAGITAFFFFPKEKELSSERISFFDFFKYKYQLNIDGTVAAYRLPYLMLSDALVLKQDSKYYEYFYKDLQPWTHYVPVKSDLSDVLEQVKWAKEHDSEAEQIAKNAREYMREHITPANIFCYYYRAFTKLASKIKSEIVVGEGFEEAEHPTFQNGCKCHHDIVRKNIHDEL